MLLLSSGPQREIFLGGTKIDAGPPKLDKEQIKKRPSLKFGPIFCPKLGEEHKKKKKGLHSNFVAQTQKLSAGLNNKT